MQELVSPFQPVGGKVSCQVALGTEYSKPNSITGSQKLKSEEYFPYFGSTLFREVHSGTFCISWQNSLEKVNIYDKENIIIATGCVAFEKLRLTI